MPYISFESTKLEKEIKQKLIEQLTEISADITGVPKKLFLVSIKEIPDDDMAVGGKTVRELKIINKTNN
ncbi:4-oxalocrotonate tautomerase [Aquimarina sp. EL_43]|uniref:tautomerase family protein n=1 Tax=Aquimarina TaxID=290174 RepID=UPI00046F53F2|nr:MULTISPECIES: tautomerase family protein [Aquimarina]MBG6131004.1 4-oxalocrotonate tautomerase [Aquimarina sp. EL_35]MBG6151463.1 4-oxalocrotonate tautomerase [Aquimarina sp. EL_32]MBG6169394.1 4-oxalocrotonate tautomerase [Aquimarina sp. EL_43]